MSRSRTAPSRRPKVSDLILKKSNEATPEKRKSGKSKMITITEHQRKMSQYIYAGVCKNCQEAYERKSFGNRFPVYCDACAVLTPKEKLKYQEAKLKKQIRLSIIK